MCTRQSPPLTACPTWWNFFVKRYPGGTYIPWPLTACILVNFFGNIILNKSCSGSLLYVQVSNSDSFLCCIGNAKIVSSGNKLLEVLCFTAVFIDRGMIHWRICHRVSARFRGTSCCAQHRLGVPLWKPLAGSSVHLFNWLISPPWSQTSTQQGAQEAN